MCLFLLIENLNSVNVTAMFYQEGWKIYKCSSIIIID